MVPRAGRDELGRRERQIMDAIYRLGEASVSQVRSELPDPPSYSSVRTMIRLLESKGLLRHRQYGKKYLYRSTKSRLQASKSAVQHLLQTFFGGSASAAVAAILDSNTHPLAEAELQRIETLIKQARKDGR